MKNRNIPFSPPDITKEEVSVVTEALLSGWITTGPKTKELEKNLAEFIGANMVATMNSATAAMEMTLRLLGVGPGDEVITSAYTYTATASVINHVGATIKLVDTQKDSVEMDYEQLANLINKKTKIIMPVDIAGKMIDYDHLFEIVENKKHLFNPSKNTLQEKFDRPIILSDAAHSLGAKRNGLNSGQVADFTCYSFHAVKNLTTAEGGAVTWQPIDGIDDADIYNKYMNLILHGQTKDAFSKNKLGSWEYDIVAPYYKANLTDIHAAIGLAQLKRYPEMLKKRSEIIRKYVEGLKELPVSFLEHHTENNTSSGHLFLMRLNNFTEEDRNEFIVKLAEKGIATNVHYKPLPLLTAYKDLGFSIDNYPNAYNYYKNEVTLPLHTKLSDGDITFIIETIKNMF